jgi:hypothetical protein
MVQGARLKIILHSNGRELLVYDATPIMRVVADRGVPLKFNGWRAMEKDAARALLREVLDAGCYTKTSLERE